MLLPALGQMRNRGNGKGGGIAAVGLDPAFFDVAPELLRRNHLVAVAYLDPDTRHEVEAEHLSSFEIDHVYEIPTMDGSGASIGAEVPPPRVVCYFVRVPPETRGNFMYEHGIDYEHRGEAEDEIVYRITYRLNRELYAGGVERAFVLSHGQNLLILKLVGFGDDVIRHYQLEDLAAHVWIGHHRYPTKGRVWHPGGAHPFVGMHEALVHNGDFANYTSMCTYLAQHYRYPLFQTDTEVAALTFDLFHRTFGYPLEYVTEAMAPTTERDFALLPEARRRVYRALQATHVHGSPDGPWFFLIAQSVPAQDAYRLIGVTDTSMLRPQVFAIQEGVAPIGLAASEKQAIDAVLEALAAEDGRFWSRADRYWNARGGSHTDGGAFSFTVHPDGDRPAAWSCTDKFGRAIRVDAPQPPPVGITQVESHVRGSSILYGDAPPEDLVADVIGSMPSWGYGDLAALLDSLEHSAAGDADRRRALHVITQLMDRRYPTGDLRRSAVLSMLDDALGGVLERIRKEPSLGHVWVPAGRSVADDLSEETVFVLDARLFAPEGPDSVARAIVELYRRGARRFLVANARGHRFLGCGLGPGSHGVEIDVYGSSGDYLGSGIDGASITVHGSAQDQIAQITASGRLVIHGDVGQAFMYAAKGGDVYVLGNAAGRPLISAVGRPKVVVNGTCLDYLAESFMAGNPLVDGGFAVVNGVEVTDRGEIRELPSPYPGGNLMSLASGGAVYVRDPHGKLEERQLNGGEFAEFTDRDWEILLPSLEENERLLRVRVEELLSVGGQKLPPSQVYRKVQPAEHQALTPEEAWVRRQNAR
jgi:glutamate synthase domain-containing protein 1/glutamate synthase domain-containing protein 3